MGKKMFQPEKYGMTLCPGVMARDIFKLKNDNLVGSVEALGRLKRKRKTRILPGIMMAKDSSPRSP